MNKYINDNIIKIKPKEIIFLFLLALAISFSINEFIIARADVKGISMCSTLYDKDVLFIEKLSLLTDSIKRGEIIVFDSNNENGDFYIKRVIGIEGDEIEIKNGKVLLNGKELKEDYLDEDEVTKPAAFMQNHKKYKIKDGEVFVLGDNRAVSYDSRYFGPIKIKDIEGHVIARCYPFDKIRGF